MKTRLFKALLVSCMLFLGIKNVEAATKSITVSALPVADLYNISGAASINSDQTNVALMGFQLKNNYTSSATITGFTLNNNGNNLQTYLPTGFKLYSYTSAVFPGTGTATLVQSFTSPNATSGTFTLTSSIVIAAGATTSLYYFIVANSFPDNVVSSTTDDNEISITGVSVSAGGFSTNAGNGPDYIISSSVTLGTASTTGLATSPLNADATGIGIMGFSITTNQSKTFTQFNLTASQNTGNYFSNVKLYRNTTNSFSGATQVTGITVSSLSSTTLTISALSQTIPTTTYYYFVVADFTAPTTGGTFQLSINSAVATSTYTNGATISGTNYTVSPPVTLGTASSTGLASTPLSTSQTGIGILGFSVAVTGTKTITQVNLTANVAASYFTNYKLYSSTSNSFAAATLVAGASISGAGTTALTASGFSQTVTNSTVYYFIVADFTAPSTGGTFQLSANSVVATATYTNGGPISSTSYVVGPITYNWVGNTATAGVYLWSTATNWSPASVPGSNDIAQIGITTYTSTHNPTVNTTASVGAINFGTNNGNNITLTANATLTIARDITVQSDDNALGNQNVNIAGTGTVNVTNVNVLATSDLLADNFDIFDIYTEILNSSVTNFNISGNVNLTSIYDIWFIFLYNYSAEFYVSGGTTTISGTSGTAGIFQTNNGYYSTSYVNVSNGNLILNNPNALSLLSSSGTNYISFNNTGSLITYTGASPTIYTSSTPNAYGGVSYKDLLINGTGTATTGSGTLTVSDNFTNSSNTDLSVNSTTTTVSNQLIPTAGTLTCGSGSLTAGSMSFTGGNLTAGSGTVTCSGSYTNNGGTFNCGSAANASVYFGFTYVNNSGTFTANYSSGSSVYFTGTNLNIQDNTTAGTTLNNVTFSGSNVGITVSTGAAGTGNFYIASTGTLTMGSNAKLTAGSGSAGGAGYLTLMSGATSTATLAQIPSNSSINGAVNVQRYITGGSNYRGYRLFSSPVNASLMTNQNGTTTSYEAFVDPTFLNSGMTTGGPGTGFDQVTTNPLMYLYDDTRASSSAQFYSGKNIGIKSITGAPSYTVTPMSTTGAALSPIKVPVGNSFLVFFAGTGALSLASPSAATVTATGYLNQGTIPMWIFNSTTAATQSLVKTGTGSSTLGLNQVGNPYASTILLSKLYSDNQALHSGNISPVFYELDPTVGMGTYLSYNASTFTTSTTKRSSNYIVSGQGFWVQASGNSVLTFAEDQKTSYPAITSTTTTTSSTTGTLLMDIPTTVSNNDITGKSFAATATPATETVAPILTPEQIAEKALVGLHLQLSIDSNTYTQTGIYFSNKWTDTYSVNDDALDRDGATPKVFLSSYSSDNKRLSLNQLGDYIKGKRIKLYVGAISSGTYSVSLADIANIDTGAYYVYLVDKKMNDSLDMVRYKSYAFNINNNDTTTYGANRFVLAIERRALPPYQLVKFAGQKVPEGVQLTWQTLNEGDYTGFVLQKLNTNNTYTMLYTLQSNNAGSYSYTDKYPITGKNTYRLQQTDIDGNITYSSPVTVTYDSKSPDGNINVYPNPSRSIITINLALNAAPTNYVADIYNTSGTVISHQVVNANTWTQDISSYKLGVYIIEVKTNSGDLVGKSKFVKIN